MMNGTQILAIPLSEPERLFQSPTGLRAEYLAMVRQWHPDHCHESVTGDEASQVTAHINALYDAACEAVKRGIWHPRGGGEMLIRGKDERTRVIKFRAKRGFEIGDVLIGTEMIHYMIPKEHDGLVLAGLRAIGGIRYPTPEFRTSLEPHLPNVVKHFETLDAGTHVISIRKSANDVTVADLTAHLGGRIDPKHAAWLVSGMLNLLSFLSVSKMTVNGLTPDTVWVNPLRHTVSFLGGWWYGAEAGKQISHLPPFCHRLAPGSMIKGKRANAILDLECARAIGRFALGDVTGGSFRLRDDIPAPITEFLRSPSHGNPIAEYEGWYKSLETAYGPRRYHELKVTGNEVYPRKD
jgi:hypothetical protein